MPGTTKFVSGWQTGANQAELQVAFAWGSAPFASTCANMLDRTWYAASTSVRRVNCFRGRTHDLDQWGPGHATIVLDNRSRLFDPTSTGTAYAPNVKPGTPVKIQVKKPGTTAAYTIWSGFTESYALNYPGMRDATCTVKCVDGMKYLALSAITSAATAGNVSDMINNVLDGAGWPSTSSDSIGWRDVAASLSQAQRYVGARSPALEMCRNLADSEVGFFFVDRVGRAFYRSRRYYKVSFKTTDAVFGDVSSQTTQLPYVDLRLDCDGYQLYNYVTVNRVRGPSLSTWSTGSIDKYGKRVLTKNNLLCPNATATLDLARWLVARYEEPGTRVERLTAKPRASTKIWNTVDSVGLGNLVRVVRHPPGGGSTFSQACYVEGITHDISVSDDDWSLSFNMTPAALFPSSSL